MNKVKESKIAKQITTELKDNKTNVEMLQQLVSEINGWDSSLNCLEVMEFDDYFFKTYFSDPQEAARATFFGNIQNWNDEYIRFNAYGNLESLNEWQYEKELLERADEIVERAIELIDKIDVDYILEGLN